ncbi:MAG: 50S ribosomal protein L32 [bacterium]|nr:50S ribosomal protein L32 [bacterium]
MVPKKRHSKSKVGRRRSQLGLKKATLRSCSACGSPTLPHRTCPQCSARPKKEVQ